MLVDQRSVSNDCISSDLMLMVVDASCSGSVFQTAKHHKNALMFLNSVNTFNRVR